jgi:archaeal flagellar protein FlaJ
MELKKIHWIGIVVSLLIIISSLFFMNTKFFFLMIGVGILAGITPFVVSIMIKTRTDNEKEEMFLEFARNLVESVNTGTPISKSIINVRGKPYGALSGNINKLANQIAIGIPLNSALKTFADDVNNKSISRSLVLIGQAERAGGDIGGILESVAEAVSMTDKLKKERKAAISNLVVQGYIIFFVFMIIVLVMQFKILPIVSGIAPLSSAGIGGVGGGSPITAQEFSNSFLYLILIQGFFSGLAIGKLSEGNIKAGIKHSFTLVVITFLVSTMANLFFGA